MISYKKLKEDATTTSASTASSTVDSQVAKYDPKMASAKRIGMGGHVVFDVSPKTFQNSRFAKNRYHAFDKYLSDEEDSVRDEIKNYARTNPHQSIVIRDKNTGLHTYLKMGKGQREK